MSDLVNQAICTLYHQAIFDIKEFEKNAAEMDALRSSYFRYMECSRKDLDLRVKIRRRYGLLGVHFPSDFVSAKTAKELAPLDNIDSDTVRRELKLWQHLEDFLSVVRKTTYAEFRVFLNELKFEEPSFQAVASAVRTHSELFEESTQDGGRTITLKDE